VFKDVQWHAADNIAIMRVTVIEAFRITSMTETTDLSCPGVLMTEEMAILAGGCYWGAQELIRRQRGVVSTRVGWSRGETSNPTDDNHGDHAEAMEITYDAHTTSYRDLLEFVFQALDPTTLNRQGNEVGRSVRSASTPAKSRDSLLSRPSQTSMRPACGPGRS
jgi:methionine-S-sulfoxide reductase